MPTLRMPSRLIISFLVVALCLAGFMILTNVVNVRAQNSQNKTMHDLVETLNAQVKKDSTFQFNINIPSSFYGKVDTFTINNTTTKIVETGDDHVCMEDSSDPKLVQTFCYSFSTIGIVYPIPKQ